MTVNESAILDIVKASLWSMEYHELVLTDEIIEELRKQSIDGLAAAVTPKSDNDKFIRAARFAKMLSVQSDAVKLIQQANIPVVVIKGTASGIYYPCPYLRKYGDIDILVHPDNYHKAIEILSRNGYVQDGPLGLDVTTFKRLQYQIEIHQRPPGLGRVKEGAYIHSFLLTGLNNIEQASFNQPQVTFPMLPWQQNGIELIWHIREHLYNGLGLRQIIDWMLFVNRHLCTENSYREYSSILYKAGLEKLAVTVTRMCQLYLGLDDSIKWCKNVDDKLCDELMEFIFDQGNFGIKRQDDKNVKALTRYRSPFSFFIALQRKGVREWKAAEKHVYFKPIAWIYVCVQGVMKYASSDGGSRLLADLNENKRRKELFDQLYKGEYEGRLPILRIKTQGITPNDRFVVKSRKSFKDRLRSVYNFVKSTPLRRPLYHFQNIYFCFRYFLFGREQIAVDDIENVENNVTFIYKSFNRRKQARQLYRCIKSYYPCARVIIADDSKVPLCIGEMDDKDVIIHLPFNSGLSKGLREALKLVNTPYVMRMDDDELLTPHTNVHKQLNYLQSHPEVDLVGIQAKYNNPKRAAEKMRSFRMRRKLIVPAGTLIDGLEVVYKTPNVYLVRTESLRKVGYDSNIRMIDHHEFFYRAAGQIVCVQNPEAYVMHCHNRFEDPKEYGDYRSDVTSDYMYIKKKHGANYK